MLFSFDETSDMISSGKFLHISGTENLLKKLPRGNWIGGSTEYFMTDSGGIVTNDLLYVLELPFDDYKIVSYDEYTIVDILKDAFDNGFSIVILPFDSEVQKRYAYEAPEFEGMFMKNIVGWVSGINLNEAGQTPIVVNGLTGEFSSDKAVAAHISVPEDKLVTISIVNIFSQDETSPIIEFSQEGFSVKNCLVNNKEVVFADYIKENEIDTRFPLVGDYSGVGINISYKAVENGVVSFYAPVFPGIEYRMAKPVTDYKKEFDDRLKTLSDVDTTFSCNCILNFLYGEFEGKEIHSFFGPITFGEVAYQLVNQTLVYVTVS